MSRFLNRLSTDPKTSQIQGYGYALLFSCVIFSFFLGSSFGYFKFKSALTGPVLSQGGNGRPIFVVYGFSLILIGVLFLAVMHIVNQEFKRKGSIPRDSEERYEDLIQLAPDPIIILDRLGFLKSVNPAAEQASLYGADELIKRHFLKIGVIAPSSITKVVAEFELAMLGQRRPPFELGIVRKDQTQNTFEVDTHPIQREGKITGIQVIFRDVSERKRLEEQIRQSQKMEAVGQLASGVAHDFNNLLTVINGYSALQLQTLPKDDPVRADFDEILKAGKLASVMTGQLLAFSRRQVFDPKVLSLNDLIQEMEKMFRRLIHEDIELIMVPAEKLWPVKVDAVSMGQVLTNLVVNSRDAMPKGGKLVIETSNTKLDEEYTRRHSEIAPGDYVLLAVSDTGPGMTDEVKKRLFEPFFTTKEKGKGTGLGLATSYGIVKQSGGSIEVYSELSKGTTFKIYLPRTGDELTHAPSRSKKPEILPRGSESILVVEDDILVRSFILRIMREQGYRVLEASNGEEAMLLAEQQKDGPIHLVITDMVMPRLGGRELSDRLKGRWPKMRVIFTSGYTENMSLHQGMLQSGEGFLQKPFSPMALANKMREVLDR